MLADRLSNVASNVPTCETQTLRNERSEIIWPKQDTVNMEPSRNPDASQNCFLRKSADGREAISAIGNEIYFYEEAEPLIYVCSQTSMPPQSTVNMRALRSAEISATCGGSPSGSKTSSKKSRKSSTMVYESAECQPNGKIRSPRSAGGSSTITKDMVSDFKSEILSKFKQFAITPNSSCSNLEGCSNSIRVGSICANTNSIRSRENKSENRSQDIEELFIHKTHFFTTSSESERVRISSEDLQDEEFSTGVSDMEEGVNKAANIKQKSGDRADFPRENIATAGLPHWFATKSIVKNVDARTDRPAARASPIRIGPPVQGRLSLRTMKNTPPCFCLLDEIRKNNLVMKEDIFSSSSPKASEFLTTHTQKVGQSGSTKNGTTADKNKMRSADRVNTRQSRDREMTNKSSNKQQTMTGATADKKNVTEYRTEAVEVYEATGGEETGADVKDKLKQGPDNHQDPATPEVNTLAANIHHVRNKCEESRRPLNPTNQNHGSERLNEGITSTTISLSSTDVNSVQQKTEDTKQPIASSNTHHQPLGTNELTSEQHFNIQMNGYLEAKTSTPNRRPEKYVKLPGLAEAFVQRDSNFKDLRIKDGTSFESVNVLEEMSMRNIANQILEIRNMKEYKEMSTRNIADRIHEIKKANIPGKEEQTQIKVETKDAAIDFRIPSKNTKTQTADSNKIMVDGFVQCESHIVDEANGRNVVKNDHQEIMVCNDNGDGVQLYNELGHPLTDMDGYLLKDSLGRFLVRLDQYGVPISCTNGQKIFMENSTEWDAVKNTMSIIHQSRKKPIKRGDTTQKGKARPSLRQLETAMRNLKNTLEWADKVSLDSSHESALNRFTEFDVGERGPWKNTKPTPNAEKRNNNTNSLIAEMKSIARLRNALLEKVNFISGNRNKLGKSGENIKSLGGKRFPRNPQESYNKNRPNDPNSIWKGEDRPYSPTYLAIKKLKSESRKEADPWKNFGDTGLTLDLPTLNKTDGQHWKVGLDLWMNSASGQSVGDDFPKKEKSGGNQQKTETDSWINPGNSPNAPFPTKKKSSGSEANETDMWNLTNDKSKDKFGATKMGVKSNYKFPVSQENTYRALDNDLGFSDMGVVSKDAGNLGQSSLESAGLKDAGFTGSQLLISLEKEYNLRNENSWIDPWKKEKSPFNGILERTKQARKWSEVRPSIEFSSSSRTTLEPLYQHIFNN